MINSIKNINHKVIEMISFLVCAFNEEKYIKATIDTINKSVNNVGFIDKFEIVIVNDGRMI